MNHTSYAISEEDDGGDFAAPGSITVRYACEEGYKLVDPKNNIVGCEYVPTLGDRQPNEHRRVRWTNADGIECIKEGELSMFNTK